MIKTWKILSIATFILGINIALINSDISVLIACLVCISRIEYLRSINEARTNK